MGRRVPRPKRERSPDRRAARLVLFTGFALTTVIGLNAMANGALSIDAIRAGKIPALTLVLLGGGLGLSIVLALMVRSIVIACEELQRSERNARDWLELKTRRFQTLEREGWDGVMIIDTLGVIRWMGVTAARILRFDPHDVVGESVLGLIDLSDVDTFLGALAVPTHGEGSTFEFRSTEADETVRWFEGTMSDHVDDDAVSGIVLHFRETTDQHMVADALQERERHVNAAFDDSPFGAAIVDADGLLRSVNDALVSLLSRERDALIDKPIGSLLSPRDRSAVRAWLRRVLSLDVELPLMREVVLSDGQAAVLAMTPIVSGPRQVGSFLLQIVSRSAVDAEIAIAEIEEDAIEDEQLETDELEQEDLEQEELEVDVLPSLVVEAVASPGWADAPVDLDIQPVLEGADELGEDPVEVELELELEDDEGLLVAESPEESDASDEDADHVLPAAEREPSFLALAEFAAITDAPAANPPEANGAPRSLERSNGQANGSSGSLDYANGAYGSLDYASAAPAADEHALQTAVAEAKDIVDDMAPVTLLRALMKRKPGENGA